MNDVMKEIRKIHAFGKELTYAEYVRICVTANMGTQSIYQKKQLESICTDREIPLSGKESKTEIYDMLIESGMQPIDFDQMASQCGSPHLCIGVISRDYQDAFSITHKDVKYLESCGALKKVGTYRTRAYGKYIYPSRYSAWQFVTMKDDEMQQLLVKKGGKASE